MLDPLSITDADRLLSMLEQPDPAERPLDPAELRREILSTVRGQDSIVDDVVRLLRQQKAKVTRDRPIANLLFLGPTGTGKTELGKALARALLGDESHALRFDCAELLSPETKTRLIGTPQGYVASEQGGQLTRPVLNNPRRVILFDEIEKAHSSIFDLFLSLMGEGRLTEQGSGRVADFTQSIVILTSNAEHEALGKIVEQVRDPYERIDAIKKHLRDARTFRPEILGRFDQVCVFRPLNHRTLAEIAAIKARTVARQYDVALEYVAPEPLFEALLDSRKVADFGVRELDRIINSRFADQFIAARENGWRSVALRVDAAGELQVEPTAGAETLSSSASAAT